ncbi:MAG: signal peptide peptidase SppA [Deltaproteobacteria bacterium CG11_big_fil_rev_8_21_14_0_20_47_16]|nr:MAG: signal peptide peptidase SppA [Deltaproteobacteria bacterium CG11_big_fil_rev_8_21_14_0_20_47_16]
MARRVLLIIGIVLIVVITVGVVASIAGRSAKGEVAIVPVEGMIVNPDHFVQQMEDLRKDKTVKAIVLRIESPGGAVAAGQEMTREVSRVAAEKPVVVSMGNVAASAGYYIASAANQIVANPGTITASIGVRMEHAEIEQLLNRWGIKMQNLKSGAFKDIGTYDRPMTVPERQLLDALLAEMHTQFIQDVARNRHLPESDVRKIADGRPMSGSAALASKLIDILGGEQDAIEIAGKLAKIQGEPTVRRMRAGPPWWQELLFDESLASLSNRFLSTINYAVSINRGGYL